MTDKPRDSTTTLRTRRQILRRRRRERQFVIFGALVFALGALAFTAYGIYSGRITDVLTAPLTTPAHDFESEITLPCPPHDSTPLPEGEVLVRVLNSTKRSGLAATALADLVGRGFQSGGTGNFKKFEFPGTVRISFGPEGVLEGYTVARMFENPEIHLDAREGHSVDVVLGLDYDGLIPLGSPELDPKLIMTATSSCLGVDLIEPEPAPVNYPHDPEVSASATPTSTLSGAGE